MYSLKAAACCATLMAVAGLAVATSLPTPPCGIAPVPAYASLGVEPAVAILNAEELDASVWRPSSCTGWPAASRSRVVVAIAGLVRVAGGAETLLARAGAVSTLRTMRYWSTTDKEWRPLFVDAAALAGPSGGGERRSDFRPSEMQAGRTFYFWVHDSRSGPLIYQMRVLEHSTQRMTLAEENVSPIRAFGLTLFQPTAVQTVVFAQRQTNDVWGLYILARIDRQTSSFIASGHDPLPRTGRWHCSDTWPASPLTRNHRPCDDLGDATGPSSMRSSPAALRSPCSRVVTRPQAPYTDLHFAALFFFVENCQESILLNSVNLFSTTTS